MYVHRMYIHVAPQRDHVLYSVHITCRCRLYLSDVGQGRFVTTVEKHNVYWNEIFQPREEKNSELHVHIHVHVHENAYENADENAGSILYKNLHVHVYT